MQLDIDNPIIKLCGEGMMMEGAGNKEEASRLFIQAWNEAKDDFEKFIAAHYVARHQNGVAEKLKWDEIALQLALKINDHTAKGSLPSLYLNIGKCHEDLGDYKKANINFHLALASSDFLGTDGYAFMIKGGILEGIERVKPFV